jgi:hypothetical protein
MVARYLVAMDLDRDGNIDVGMAEEGGQQIAVALGKPDGTLQPPIGFDVGLPTSGLVHLDVDGDRWSDLLVVSPVGYCVLRNLARQ